MRTVTMMPRSPLMRAHDMPRAAVPPMRLALVAVCAAGLSCLGACSTAREASDRAELHRFREMVMGVEMTVVVDDDSADRAAGSARAAFDAARAVDEALSDWTSSSGLRDTARAAASAPPGTPVPASPALIDATMRAAEMSRITGGAFDCTAAPIVALWRKARSAGVPPQDGALAEARERVGYQKVHADPSGATLRFDISGMSLDFGGIGKGIASSAALAAARRAGCERVLVAVSGDIAAGAAPRGREGWQVAIESGLGTLAPCVVWLRESALSTSGDAEQVLVHGGQRHSHIVDPRTGRAVSHSIAPTVWSTDPAVADAAATALSVLGVGEMDTLCERIRASGTPIEMRVACREAPDGPVLIRVTPNFPVCAGAREGSGTPPEPAPKSRAQDPSAVPGGR